MNYDWVSYGLMIIACLVTLMAQILVMKTYKKYTKTENQRKITGAQAARRILDKNNLQDVSIVLVNGYLTDHYDARKKEVRLSRENYYGSSISSVSVAIHECGHAIQDRENYLFMKIRSKLIPVVSFSSYMGYIAILLGLLFGMGKLIWVGIILECIILGFQIVTLPVEIDASKRALRELDYSHFFNSNELKKGKNVLGVAALTYVASVASTLMEICRLILIFGKKER